MIPDHVFDALGNSVRRDIIESLRAGPRRVGDLANDFSISRPAVSKHVQILNDADLVAIEPNGRTRIVSLNREGFDVAKRYLDTFWDDLLSSFASHMERDDG